MHALVIVHEEECGETSHIMPPGDAQYELLVSLFQNKENKDDFFEKTQAFIDAYTPPVAEEGTEKAPVKLFPIIIEDEEDDDPVSQAPAQQHFVVTSTKRPRSEDTTFRPNTRRRLTENGDSQRRTT